MKTLEVKYDAVHAEVARMRQHTSSNVVDQANVEHRQMQAGLRGTDGAAQAVLMEALEANRQKAVMAASTMERLCRFVGNAAKQIEVSENQMARTFASSRR